MLFEVLRECLCDRLLNKAGDGGVPELRFRLAFELWIAKFHGDDRGEALANIVSFEVVVLVLEDIHPLGGIVYHQGKGGTKSRKVRSALVGVDVVRERIDRFGVSPGPLKCDLQAPLWTVAHEFDHLGMEFLT